MCWCVKETSPSDVSFTQQQHNFDVLRSNNISLLWKQIPDNNHFWGVYEGRFLCS